MIQIINKYGVIEWTIICCPYCGSDDIEDAGTGFAPQNSNEISCRKCGGFFYVPFEVE